MLSLELQKKLRSYGWLVVALDYAWQNHMKEDARYLREQLGKLVDELHEEDIWDDENRDDLAPEAKVFYREGYETFQPSDLHDA